MKLKLLAGLVFFVGLIALTPAPAHAVAPIDDSYNNRIIDDQVFINAGTMQAADIQAFLNSKVAACGNSLCLRNYSEGGRSAARIIYDVSVSVGMNPQVLLSTLQKEQSLITNPAPSSRAIGFAMGYGCPEGPGCNPAYNGFTNQLTLGAKLMRAGVARNCGDTWTVPGWWINPKWHMNNTVTVDGRPTFLANCATGSLYNYTPHRPDSAYRGATDGTLYYGNYNFIKNFTAWFGSTRTTSWNAQYLGQSNAPYLAKGQSGMVSATYRNTGNTTWTQNKVFLGTDRPRDRASGFAGGAGWASPTRARMQESSVAPGQDAHFVFAMTANPAVGYYEEHMRPVVEGVTWMEDVGLSFPEYVAPTSYGAQVTEFRGPDQLGPGRRGTVTVRVRNLGASVWMRGGATPFRLGTQQSRDHTSALYTAGEWSSPSRIPMQEASVPPFGTATFRFTLTAPVTGRYTEHLAPVIETVTWLGAPIDFTVETGGTYDAAWAGQSAYPAVTPGQTAAVYVDFKNTGTATWYNNGPHVVRLGTDNPRDRSSPSRHASWIGPNRPGSFTGRVSGGSVTPSATIAPGQTARFAFTVTGPPAGNYREYFRPLSEGRTWFGPADTVSLDVNTAPHYSARWVGQSQPAPLAGTGEQTAWIEFRNAGNQTWQRGGAAPFRLGTTNPRDRSSGLAGSTGWVSPSRIQLDQSSVGPGQVGRFTFTFKANGKPRGTYREYFRPLVEGVTWLEDWGVSLPVTIN